MGNKRIPIEADKIYHVFNHGIAKEDLFRTDENFLYFLRKYNEHVSPIADTLAYCLMPNHFHLLVWMKSEEELIKYYKILQPTGFINPSVAGLGNPSDNITTLNSQIFGNFFNAYTKAYNKRFNRKGRLYQQEFDRRLVDKDDYFRRIVHYIHFNPVHHGFVDDLRDWKYSSYSSFFSASSSKLQRETVIEWFGDFNGFVAYHQKEIGENILFDLDCL